MTFHDRVTPTEAVVLERLGVWRGILAELTPRYDAGDELVVALVDAAAASLARVLELIEEDDAPASPARSRILADAWRETVRGFDATAALVGRRTLVTVVS